MKNNHRKGSKYKAEKLRTHDQQIRPSANDLVGIGEEAQNQLTQFWKNFDCSSTVNVGEYQQIRVQSWTHYFPRFYRRIREPRDLYCVQVDTSGMKPSKQKDSTVERFGTHCVPIYIVERHLVLLLSQFGF